MAKRKRLVVISDLHCGHAVGLTPPAWQWAIDGDTTEHRAKFGHVQRDVWNWYSQTIGSLKPIDILAVNGDAIDGTGVRSGGVELLTSDRQVQADIAIKAIQEASAKTIVMTYGTPYHTGTAEDWEDRIAEHVRAKSIGGHEWFDVNGVIFDFKHFIGGSAIPHGRHTAIARDKLWNDIWNAEHEMQPKADVLIRSHVHYHAGSFGTGWLGMTTPALQGFGSRYGVRNCSGVVDIGLVYFDVDEKGKVSWECLTADLSTQRVKALQL